MKKIIRIGKNYEYVSGIIKLLQGKTVEVSPHPSLTGMWQFEYFGQKYIASDYAFEKEK